MADVLSQETPEAVILVLALHVVEVRCIETAYIPIYSIVLCCIVQCISALVVA